MSRHPWLLALLPYSEENLLSDKKEVRANRFEESVIQAVLSLTGDPETHTPNWFTVLSFPVSFLRRWVPAFAGMTANFQDDSTSLDMTKRKRLKKATSDKGLYRLTIHLPGS